MTSRATRALLLFTGASALLGASCGSSSSDAPSPGKPSQLTREELMDPRTCASCHPNETTAWSGSMHAYAADDPVFLAMNQRGQRETNGALGTFCVGCHAPMAVRTGMTTDGQNLASLPASLRGVTCYFCHSVDDVQGSHDDPLHLAGDGVMRGAIRDPLASTPHGAAYSSLHDRDTLASSKLCGSCHDIRTDAGADVATTFAEWQGTLFAHDVPGERLSCSSCHMPETVGAAAMVSGAPATRKLHDHGMPGVDTALIDFPEKAAQRDAVQMNLDPSLVVKLCITPPATGSNVSVTLDNAFVGHAFPSGAAYDRRVWVEVVAYQAGQVVWSTGVVPDGTSVTTLADPNLWLFRTTMQDASGADVLFQWQASTATPTFVPPTVTNDAADPLFYHSITRSWLTPIGIDRVTARVRITAFDPVVLASLVDSGDLDPQVAAAVPVTTLGGSVREWTADLGFTCVPAP